MIRALVLGTAAFCVVHSFIDWREHGERRRKLDTLLEIRRPDPVFVQYLPSLAAGVAVGLAVFLTTRGWVWAGLGTMSGFMFPLLQRRERQKKEGRRWRRDFPDFLEFLALALSSGLPFHAAFQKAATSLPASGLKSELEQSLHEMKVGKARAECLEDLGRRLADRKLQRTLALLVYSLKQGGSLDDILKEQASALRTEHFLMMERRAQTLPLRLLFPIFVFLLPAVMLILLGPMMIQIAQRGSLF